MFDPEKVERITVNANFSQGDNNGKWYDCDVVQADDYDQLLALYRDLRKYADNDLNLPQRLWSNERYSAEVALQKQSDTSIRIVNPSADAINLGMGYGDTSRIDALNRNTGYPLKQQKRRVP